MKPVGDKVNMHESVIITNGERKKGGDVMQAPQSKMNDEQLIQLMNKVNTKVQGALATLDDCMNEMKQIFSIMYNQKNQEIAAVKESMVKAEITKKIDEKKA